MPETNISSAAASDLANAMTDFSVAPVTTDAAADQPETTYINSNWTKQLGYYKKIPELKSAIDALARWTIGKGFVASQQTTFILDFIKGHGKDTFNTILENQTRVAKIGGDSYAEIIRGPDGEFVNLKPLDPEVIRIMVNRKGIIIRYEQINKIKKALKKFKPEEIFHLSRNRTADEMHGESLIDAVEEIILMRNEAMSDMKKLMHRHVQPRIIWKLDTDDTSKIAEFKTKADKANADGENLYIPLGTVEYEIQGVPPNSTLNPLPWITLLTNLFYQACGVPQIIVGGAQEFTEATAKIVYLAFEQTIKEEQLYIQEQVGQQLGIEIELQFPASLENELLAAKAKEETTQAATPEDTSVQGVGL